jgi:hypothetical protein
MAATFFSNKARAAEALNNGGSTSKAPPKKKEIGPQPWVEK